MDSIEEKRKIDYLHERRQILKEFGVKLSQDIVDKLESLYPNEIAIENYSRKLIMDRLNRKKNNF